jgi:hypothetical protein
VPGGIQPQLRIIGGEFPDDLLPSVPALIQGPQVPVPPVLDPE